jgi:hypothetical protein
VNRRTMVALTVVSLLFWVAAALIEDTSPPASFLDDGPTSAPQCRQFDCR